MAIIPVRKGLASDGFDEMTPGGARAWVASGSWYGPMGLGTSSGGFDHCGGSCFSSENMMLRFSNLFDGSFVTAGAICDFWWPSEKKSRQWTKTISLCA